VGGAVNRDRRSWKVAFLGSQTLVAASISRALTNPDERLSHKYGILAS
jgi:hypothetical protein